MSSSPSVAADLSNDARKGLAILSLSKAEPIAHLADREGVSRQFLYRQTQKAVEALDEAFDRRGHFRFSSFIRYSAIDWRTRRPSHARVRCHRYRI